jgi:hypothetical protein
MVHVVEESIYGQGYREINQQLAREVGELRQQLAQHQQEIYQLRIEIHQKDVEIVQLKGQLKSLNKVQERYKAIRDIVGRESFAARESTVEEQSTVEKENDATQTRSNNAESYYLVPIPEVTEHEEEVDEEIGYATESEHDFNRLSPANDSLEPPEVTSVPPVDYCERTMQTPSIWNCLDTLGSPSSFPKEHQQNHNNDILHSTPVQPARPASKKVPEPEPKPEPEPEQAPRYNLRKRAKR